MDYVWIRLDQKGPDNNLCAKRVCLGKSVTLHYVGNTSLPKYECGMSLLAERRLACCDVTILSNNRGLLSKIQFPFEVMAELECDAHCTTSWRICKNLYWNCCCIA